MPIFASGHSQSQTTACLLQISLTIFVLDQTWSEEEKNSFRTSHLDSSVFLWRYISQARNRHAAITR